MHIVYADMIASHMVDENSIEKKNDIFKRIFGFPSKATHTHTQTDSADMCTQFMNRFRYSDCYSRKPNLSIDEDT